MSFIIIFAGRGILVPLYLLISVAVTAIISKILSEYVGSIFELQYSFQIVIGIGFLISGLWCYCVRNDYIVVDGKRERIYLNNHFFFLSLKMWSYIFFYGGILIFIGGILETLESLK